MFYQRLRLARLVAAFVAVAIMAASSVWVAAGSAADDITVYLDGRVLSFSDVHPQMINDSVMVPFRAIGEEMGADVDWNASSGVAELTLGDRFVRLTINRAVMDYGHFEGSGVSRTEFDVNMYVLSSPPIIIDGRTLVPLRAISEGLGGTAEWVGKSRTALLTSPEGAGSSAPTPSPTPNKTFANTPWFENISPARVQSMYDNDEKFVLVYYSDDSSSRLLIPLIQAAARNSGVKTYAVDSRLPDVGDLKFIWRYVDEDDILYPTIFRVFGKGSVGVSIQPNHQENLTNLLSLFARNLMDDPNAPWNPSATPTPTPKSQLEIEDTLDIRFNSIDLAAATRKLNAGDTFIYVFYRSTLPGSDGYLNMIKRAAIEAEVDIFATDASQLQNYSSNQIWWGNPDGRLLYPTVFFISDRFPTLKEVQPEDRAQLVQLFKAHHY